MAKDKLFLAQLAKIHPKNKTPHLAILFQTILTTVLVIVGAGSYTTLLHLLVPMVLVMYSFVLLSVVVLRFKKPRLRRYYKVPLGKVGPILVVMFLVFLIGMWIKSTHGAWEILKLAFSMIFLGIPVYFLIEMYYDPKAIMKVNEFLSHYLGGISERMIYPARIRRRVLLMLGNLERKKILEYGCGTGILTKQLAKKVTKKGAVYATDFTLGKVKRADKRTKKDKHVLVFHHPSLEHFKTRVKIPKVDAVVSVGILSYLQKPKVVLRHLGKKVKKRGRVVFLDYNKFFYVIPNVPWISEEKKLKRIFREAGFKVNVVKKRGLLWQYVFIHGEKI